MISDTRFARSLDHRPDLLARLLDQQPAARLGPLVDEHDVGPELRGRGRGAEPAAPPPTTSTSACRRRYSVRHSRSGCSSASRPSPAAWRSTFSYSGHSRRGRMNVL